MCNQMVTSEIRKLFPDFTRKAFDYRLISWVTNRFRLSLFTRGGVKPFEYFIQLLKKNHLHVFLKAIFITPSVKNSHLVNCLLLRI